MSKPFVYLKPLNSYFDPDEMLHNVAFHQGLLRANQSSGIEMKVDLENSTLDPLKYKID